MRALEFAIIAHDGQRRKYGTDEPYILHPVRVAYRLKDLDFEPHVISAALLHDVVEDTAVTIAEIALHFGSEVAKLVNYMTRKPCTLPRAECKAIDRAHYATGSFEAQSIKLADIADNTENIYRVAPADFAEMYLKEQEALVKVLTNGHPMMVQAAKVNISFGLGELKRARRTA